MEGSGIINLLKPAGMTSHDAVAFMRRLTGIKRIGHTGTLDPMAIGVLPICIGNATRIMDYLDMDEKSYRCEMILGITTDTQDIWGSLLEDHRELAQGIKEEQIKNAMEPLLGEIYQIPPLYSSVRVAGKHLYEYARKGEEIEVAKRPVIIKSLKLISYQSASGRVLFDVTCSKGTYVRSLCHEIGQTLGCGASMSFLIRTASGAFTAKDAVTIESLKEGVQPYLLPTDYPLGKLGKLEIASTRVKWFINGGNLRESEVRVVRPNTMESHSGHIRVREGLDQAYIVFGENRFLGVVHRDEAQNRYTVDKVIQA